MATWWAICRIRAAPRSVWTKQPTSFFRRRDDGTKDRQGLSLVPSSRRRKKLVGCFVQTLLGAARIRQMAHHVAIQLVNVRTLKIVKLLTFKAENLIAHNHTDVDAIAAEYVAVHDRPPIGEAPQWRLPLFDHHCEPNHRP